MKVCSIHQNVPLRRDRNTGDAQKCTKKNQQTGRTCTNPVAALGDSACESCSDAIPCCAICGREDIKP